MSADNKIGSEQFHGDPRELYDKTAAYFNHLLDGHFPSSEESFLFYRTYANGETESDGIKISPEQIRSAELIYLTYIDKDTEQALKISKSDMGEGGVTITAFSGINSLMISNIPGKEIFIRVFDESDWELKDYAFDVSKESWKDGLIPTEARLWLLDWIAKIPEQYFFYSTLIMENFEDQNGFTHLPLGIKDDDISPEV